MNYITRNSIKKEIFDENGNDLEIEDYMEIFIILLSVKRYHFTMKPF